MESVLFKGAYVPGQGSVDVGVRGGRIDLVGRGEAGNYDRVIAADNCALLPGFVNAHGHAAMTLLRSAADDLPLQQWLEEKIWPLEARLNSRRVYWGTMLAIAEMIRSGTTTFTDMYFFEDAVAQAAEETGIRAVLSRGLVAVGPGFDQAMAETREFVRTWQGRGDGRITTLVGPHAPYTCPQPYLEEILDLARELGRPLQIHLAETRSEVEESRRQYGKSPVAVLEEAGMFALPVLAAHCVHLSPEDIDILARYDVRVAHNPTSNLKLGSGIAPVPALLAKGVTVGLGTDGAASNNNLDMMEEIRLAALIHKGAHHDPTLISAQQALAMATAMGARAVFLEEEIGAIREGFKADLILMDLDKPHLTPRHNVEAHIVYAAQASDICLVMVDGKILLEDGHLTTIDEERVLYEAARAARELLEQ